MRAVDTNAFSPAPAEPQFDGKVIKSILSKDFFIISCADCLEPRVVFIDRFDLTIA